MQAQPSHWRKIWPEGDTDNGDEDAEVLNMFTYRTKPPGPPKNITYPWAYDEDVTNTNISIAQAQTAVGSNLSNSSVKERGLNMIFSYDNTKVQYERDLPVMTQNHSKPLPLGVIERRKMVERNEADALQHGFRKSSQPPDDKGFKYEMVYDN